VHLTTHSAEATQALGRALAVARGARVADGEELAVVWLTGDLGAGKTTFVRGFLQGLGEAEPVRSPTFTLVDVHELEGVTVLHIDLYRLHDEAELESLGLRDWARPGYLWLIEWPERAAARLPQPDLVLTFRAGVPAHEIELRAATTLGNHWLSALERPPG